MATLQDTVSAIQGVLAVVAEQEGELTDDLDRELTQLEADLGQRLRACARARERLAAEVREASYWVERLVTRLKRAQRQLDGLEAYMIANMLRAEVREFETTRHGDAVLAEVRLLLTKCKQDALTKPLTSADLLDTVQRALEVLGSDGFPPVSVRARQNPGRTVVPPEALAELPGTCFVPQGPKLDLRMVRELLEAGAELPPGVTVQRDWRLEVR